MMHGREKSDPAVVAMKPAKSAAQAAGEQVERRAGAKGKAEQGARTGHSAGQACISNLLRLRHAYTLPSSPEVGARCLNWARRVLCGGRTVTCVPTATGGASVRVFGAKGGSPIQACTVRPVFICNCVAARRGGEQQKEKKSSVG